MLRSSRKQELKETMYLNAMKLFTEKGFDQVTVDEITAACGVAKGTFYNYFPKKESILLHLSHSQMELLSQSLAAHTELPHIKDRIAATFTDLTARYGGHPELLRITLAEMVRTPAMLGEEMAVIRSFQSELVPLLEEAKRKGQMDADSPTELAASVLVGIYFQALTSFAAGAIPTIDQLRMSLTQQVDLIWNGLRCRTEGSGEQQP
jgi:AcrR family transcriptional regulator